MRVTPEGLTKLDKIQENLGKSWKTLGLVHGMTRELESIWNSIWDRRWNLKMKYWILTSYRQIPSSPSVRALTGKNIALHTISCSFTTIDYQGVILSVYNENQRR